MEVTINH